MPNCQFIRTCVPDLVRCIVCQRLLKTKSPPEKCRATCRELQHPKPGGCGCGKK